MASRVIQHGDCLDVMAAMDAESIDAIVTDPPYGLEFMGKEWDAPWRKGVGLGGNTGGLGAVEMADGAKRLPLPSHLGSPNPTCRNCGGLQRGRVGKKSQQPCRCDRPTFDNVTLPRQVAYGEWSERWAREAFRVAKPSAYLLAFGGTRTVHRMVCAIEDAGWIIRDLLVWAYASGFPKSKASLKPAWEPIVMARKPGPLRMLAIDECRIGGDVVPTLHTARPSGDAVVGRDARATGEISLHVGRWPANVILTDSIFDGDTPGVVGGGWQSGGGNPTRRSGIGYQSSAVGQDDTGLVPFDTEGSYSRFFLIPKADRADREPVLGGLPNTPTTAMVPLAPHDVFRCEDCQRTHPMGDVGVRTVCARCGSSNLAVSPAAMDGTGRGRHPTRSNTHPTVKPTELMRHLVRLVTPTGGTVLDPFLGSGSTALAAEMEGFAWVGIEREAEYVAIAEARLNGTQRGLGLETA